MNVRGPGGAGKVWAVGAKSVGKSTSEGHREHVRGPQENGHSGFRRMLWEGGAAPGSREPESITSAP